MCHLNVPWAALLGMFGARLVTSPLATSDKFAVPPLTFKMHALSFLSKGRQGQDL